MQRCCSATAVGLETNTGIEQVKLYVNVKKSALILRSFKAIYHTLLIMIIKSVFFIVVKQDVINLL